MFMREQYRYTEILIDNIEKSYLKDKLLVEATGYGIMNVCCNGVQSGYKKDFLMQSALTAVHAK